MQVRFVDAPATNAMQTNSKWAFMTQDKNRLQTGVFLKAKKTPADVKPIQLWTDEYSNLFELLTY